MIVNKVRYHYYGSKPESLNMLEVELFKDGKTVWGPVQAGWIDAKYCTERWWTVPSVEADTVKFTAGGVDYVGHKLIFEKNILENATVEIPPAPGINKAWTFKLEPKFLGISKPVLEAIVMATVVVGAVATSAFAVSKAQPKMPEKWWQ